ncbi:MAG TPA: alpha/beta hydrolase [Baekduia sp.]|uniref:alpha/beta hydrolase n=1 Tax=Baekduia sp. TaxID=2600305 RepID=UPI002D78A5EE|nr:alpha/beta hydrolase [Baekduia sp.]HET6506487.1 alpha/beta hydrolase [Baekduia sp.]
MTTTLTLLPGRLEAWAGSYVARALFKLPPSVLARLAGRPPAEVAGIHPEALLLGKLAAITPDRMSDAAPVPEQRRRLALQARGLAAPTKGLPLTVSDHRAPGRGGDIPVRLYVPAAAPSPGPLLVYFHGGGWVQGSVETHDAGCRMLAHLSGVRVLSVDYRLAPEHPYPAAVEDAVSAYAWAADHAASLGADPARLAVGGDSAGGCLATVTALHARDDERLPDAVFQLLLYPATDVAGTYPSHRTFAKGYLLTASGMDYFLGKYLPDVDRRTEWRASPLRAETLRGLPPAYVATCLPDVLRDEGDAYVARMREEGVKVAAQRHDQLHGFFNTAGVRSSGRALAQIAGALRQGLAHR